MKQLILTLTFGFSCLILVAQNTDPVLDSLKRPLPPNISPREYAERLEAILSYTLDDQYDLPHYSHQLDSLYHCCIKGKTGNLSFEHHIDGIIPMYQGVALLYINPPQAGILIDSARQKFSANGDSAGLSIAYMYLGSLASAQGDSLKFAEVYPKSLALSRHITVPYTLATVYNNLAISCFDFGRFAESAELVFRILDLIDQHPTPDMLEGKAGVLTNLGAIYTRLGDNQNARAFAEKALLAAQAQQQDLAEIYSQLAWTLIVDKAYQKALDIYETRLLAPGIQPSLNTIAATTYASALCHRKLGNLPKALELARKGVQELTIEKHASFGAAAMLELANCEFEATLTETALKHALIAHQTFFKAKNNGGVVESAELLTKIYQTKGDYRKALEYSDLRYKFQQQIERQQSTRQLAFGEFTRNAAAEKARREAEIQAQLTLQRNIRYALYAGLIVFALLALLLYNRFRFKQKTAEQLEAKNREVEAARARAEASEAFKSRFLANMSHEIRTPLHGIAGFTDLLLETSLSEKQRRWLSSIHHSTDRLSEVVNDILDLSKLEAEEVKLRQAPFSPARVAADVCEALQLRAENKGIQLQLEIHENVPPAVLGDSTRLYQILMNLAGNAVKFTEQGSVTVAIDGVTSSHPVNGQALQFTVSDTGIGIPADKLSSIFESFQQASEDTTARFGGTGLGLSIARELVQLHGSDIQVESEPGKGTVFSFVIAFPPADVAALEQIPATESLFFTQKLRVLLADDNALNREIATEALLRHFENAEIKEAVNGKEVLDWLKQQSFDLILMDMQMPEMSGMEATRHIREHLLSEIPIIALTASATPEEINNALASGMNRHLGKPFKPAELARVVVSVLNLMANNFHDKALEASSPKQNIRMRYPDFDLHFLEDFCEGDEVQMQYFLDKFESQYPLEINKLKDALAREDREAVYRLAHGFRPQLAFVGLQKAAATMLQIEQGSRQNASFEELEALLHHM
ncbi:MAG: response regulator [Saprospiraceae bacterium]|nr:response regulator [Saprospiraceae bacterium]